MENSAPYSFDKIQFIVKPWGNFSTAEMWNACDAADVAQDCFVFKKDYEPLPLRTDSYRLPDGGLDLDKSVRDMMRKSYFKPLLSNNLILVTTAPYSERGANPNEVDGVSLPGFFHEADVLGYGKVSIISTYLWDNLKLRPDISAIESSASGRRAWEPYLLSSFAVMAVDKLIRLDTHNETLACPNDYCDNVSDIDAFFERGKWFCEKYCNPTLKKAFGFGKFHTEQLKAIKRILNRARGQSAADGYDSCFISYGTPDIDFAKRIYNDLKARNIECWIYDEDSLPGDPTWPSINAARRFAERVLIICSSNSLTRPGHLKELETQIDENRDKLIPIAVDKQWLSNEFIAERGLINLMPFLHERNYADFVNKPYDEALERLVKALHWK